MSFPKKIPQISLLLPNIRSAYNVGSFFRTCDGLGIGHIFLSGYTAVPPHKEIAKTALGAEDMVSWSQHPDPVALVSELQQKGVCVTALELSEHSVPLTAFTRKFPLCLVVGNEVEGVSKDILRCADEQVHIPMQGKKESFNVMIAGSIALWHISQKLN